MKEKIKAFIEERPLVALLLGLFIVLGLITSIFPGLFG